MKKLNTNTKIHSIRRKLKAKHGMVKELKLYLGTVSPSTELTDDNATLEDVGIKGVPEAEGVNPTLVLGSTGGATKATGDGEADAAAGGGEVDFDSDAATAVIYYDYEPIQHESPLLLVSPRHFED